MTDDLKQAARDLIALDGERTPGEWSILNKPERGLQLISFPLSAHDQPDEQWSLGAIWSGGEKALTHDAKFVIHNANHAPAIAQAYLDQCEEVERLRKALVECGLLIFNCQRILSRYLEPGDKSIQTEHEVVNALLDLLDGPPARRVNGLSRKALGEQDV